MNEICRVCLSSKDLRPLSNTAEDKKTFGDILSECTKYKVFPFDALPKHICGRCESAALNAFQFKRECEESYCQLMTQLQLKIGVGPVEKYTQTEQSTYPVCDHCEEKYMRFNRQESNHNDDEDVAISCRFCGKSINRNSSSCKFSTQDQSSLLCPICKRQFTLRKHLIRHLNLIHKAENVVKDPLTNSLKRGKFRKKTMDGDKNAKDEEQRRIISRTDGDNDNDEAIEKLNREFIKDEIEHVFIGEYSGNSNDTERIADLVTQLEETAETQSSIDQSPSRESSPNPNEETTYACKKCPKIYKKDVFLRKHIKTRHAQPVFKKISCAQCDETFLHISKYQQHQRAKHSKQIHKCSICDKNFSSKIYLQRHIAIHEKKRYVCKECTQVYTTKEELNMHLKAEGHDKPLLCPECGLRCKTSSILMVHMRRHKGEKPFKCKFCSKGFPRIDDLRIHEKYHTGEKSHFCETCGKGFQRKYNLTIHLRVHTGEKPYKCPHCPQAFAQGNDLKAHIRRHTGERFRCELCNAAFLQGYQIRQHKLNEHGIREDPPTQRVAKFTSTEAQEIQIKQNLQKELIHSSNERTLDENNLNIDMESLPLEIGDLQASASDVLEVSLEVADFSHIQF